MCASAEPSLAALGSVDTPLGVLAFLKTDIAEPTAEEWSAGSDFNLMISPSATTHAESMTQYTGLSYTRIAGMQVIWHAVGHIVKTTFQNAVNAVSVDSLGSSASAGAGQAALLYKVLNDFDADAGSIDAAVSDKFEQHFKDSLLNPDACSKIGSAVQDSDIFVPKLNIKHVDIKHSVDIKHVLMMCPLIEASVQLGKLNALKRAFETGDAGSQLELFSVRLPNDVGDAATGDFVHAIDVLSAACDKLSKSFGDASIQARHAAVSVNRCRMWDELLA